MGFLCSDPPDPPDFEGAAKQTAASDYRVNQSQTYANRPNQTTPWGEQTWESEGGAPGAYNPDTGTYEGFEPETWTQTTTLNPDSQRALDAELGYAADKAELGAGMVGRIEEEFTDPFSFDNIETPKGDVVQNNLGGIDSPEYNQSISETGTQRDLDYSGIDELGPADRYRTESIDASYNQATSRLDPQWEQREDQTRARLRAQGLRPGDPAFDQEIENMGRERNDAYSSAQNIATGRGVADADTMWGMDSERRGIATGEVDVAGEFYNQGGQQEFDQSGEVAQFDRTGEGMAFDDETNLATLNFNQDSATFGQQNTLRQQDISEYERERGGNLNEINAIMSGEQVQMPNMPSFNQANKAAGVDFSGAANSQWNADMDKFSAQQANKQMVMSGVTDFAGAVPSDRRLKKNIQRVGKHPCGAPLYVFQYLWNTLAYHVGVMADEVIEFVPEAVYVHKSGYMMVDYGALK